MGDTIKRREYDRQYHIKHRREAADHQRKRIVEYREWLKPYSTPCIVCGSIKKIHFHHISGTEKLFKISAGWSYRRLAVLVEMAKCVCMCHSCHLHEHYLLRKKS